MFGRILITCGVAAGIAVCAVTASHAYTKGYYMAETYNSGVYGKKICTYDVHGATVNVLWDTYKSCPMTIDL